MAPARRKIVSSMYDSDEDISFCGDRIATVARMTLMQKISIHTQNATQYGQQLANNAIKRLVESDSEDNEGSETSFDSRHSTESRRARLARRKAVRLLLASASNCAATLTSVAGEATNPCPARLHEDDESSVGDDERPRRAMRRKPRKYKKRSSARPHGKFQLSN